MTIILKFFDKELIYGNLRLVLSIIQRFTNRKENLDDLFQVGCIGLIKALDNFDLTRLKLAQKIEKSIRQEIIFRKNIVQNSLKNPCVNL